MVLLVWGLWNYGMEVFFLVVLFDLLGLGGVGCIGIVVRVICRFEMKGGFGMDGFGSVEVNYFK